VVQYQAVLQMAQSAPQIYDLPQLHRQMIEVLGVKNADKLVPTADDVNPTDPVSENMAALVGKPVRAFIYQDQDAHIATHMAFMQDPQVAQMIGQNPQAQQIMASLQAHIAEHLGFKYRKQIEERLGVELPPPGEELPEEIEVNLSRLVADAGKQLTQANQQQAAQQAAQQQQQDPMFQLQQQELQVKAQEVQRKAAKDQVDAQIKQEEQKRKLTKDMVDAKLEEQRIELEKLEVGIDAKKAGVKLRAETRAAQNKADLEVLNILERNRNK